MIQVYFTTQGRMSKGMIDDPKRPQVSLVGRHENVYFYKVVSDHDVASVVSYTNDWLRRHAQIH